MKRICKKCGKEKEIEEFVKNKECRYGYEFTCKQCRNKTYRTEKTRERDRRRYEAKLTVCIRCEICKIFFLTTPHHAKNGAKYCSHFCQGIALRGIKRPNYVMDIMKKTWIKPKQRLSPKTEFKKGEISKNKIYFSKEEKLEADRIRKQLPENREKERKSFYFTRDNLTDSYVKIFLRKKRIKNEDITPEMIELKRELITFHRLEKELKNGINSR